MTTPQTSPKNLTSCARCHVVSLCDTHITGGEWKHKNGVVPCVVRLV